MSIGKGIFEEFFKQNSRYPDIIFRAINWNLNKSDYVGDFLEKVPHHFLKHSRLSSVRYTHLDTLLVLVTSLKKRYSIVFSSSSPKNFQTIDMYKVCRQKVAVQSTAARSTPLQEKTSKMSSFIFDVFFFSRAFCLLFPLSV